MIIKREELSIDKVDYKLRKKIKYHFQGNRKMGIEKDI